MFPVTLAEDSGAAVLASRVEALMLAVAIAGPGPGSDLEKVVIGVAKTKEGDSDDGVGAAAVAASELEDRPGLQVSRIFAVTGTVTVEGLQVKKSLISIAFKKKGEWR